MDLRDWRPSSMGRVVLLLAAVLALLGFFPLLLCGLVYLWQLLCLSLLAAPVPLVLLALGKKEKGGRFRLPAVSAPDAGICGLARPSSLLPLPGEMPAVYFPRGRGADHRIQRRPVLVSDPDFPRVRQRDGGG